MKKIIIAAVSVVFVTTLTLNLNFNSAKNELAIENSKALAGPQTIICPTGLGTCILHGIQWWHRGLGKKPMME